ncbi:MAG: hypothetical protein KBS81_04530, partial [Spirochaetales bacterium]|nr:hypothetical protein [Candidatus Physcosoma equi]
MKKLFILVSLLVIALSCIFAANTQKIYPVDHEIYRNISRIYVMTGHAVPSTSGPWSTDELEKMISVIDRSEVPEGLL